MAPENSPGRKKRDRDNQFFEVGVQGRKTGITLPVNDKDEHGIENLDGIFSSPEKSPAKVQRVVRNGNTTLTSSDMDVAQSSAPEPTEVLSTRRILKSTKTVFPPPLGRSPYKTNIGSSPRRQSSVAPMSQARRTSRTPDHDSRAASHPIVSRRLDFSADEAEAAVARSPLRQAARRGGARTRKDIYQLTVSPERPLARQYEEDIREEEEEIAEAEQTLDVDVTDAQVNGNYEDDGPLMDESMQLLDEEPEPDQLPSSPSVLRKSRTAHISTPEPDNTLEAEAIEDMSMISNSQRGGRTRNSLTNGNSAASQAKITKKAPGKNPIQKAPGKPARGKKGKSLLLSAPVQSAEDSVSQDLSAAEEPTVLDETADESATEQPPAKKRGRRSLAQKAALEESQDESSVRQAPSKKRGRPAKKVEASIIQDDTAIRAEDESIVEPVQKKKRGRPPKVQTASNDDDESSQPTKKAKPSAKAPPKAPVERAKASKMGPPTFKKPAARVAPNSPAKRSVRAPSVTSTAFGGSRSYMILRQGTPLEDEGTRKTRSGRIAVPPVNFWLGEKVEYGRDGAKIGMQFAEVVDLPKIERHGTVPARRKRKAIDMDVIEEEEDDILEEWEERAETLRVFVNRWDPILGTTGDEEEEQAIAYGKNSVDIETVGGGAKFGFTKTHSSTFFGTGIMEIPPGGYKLKKNSRKMTMAFFMHTGKVDVMVADTEFAISKGGIWHVPRGNVYSIHNPGEKTARIFFAQGCQVPAEVDE